MTAREFCNWFQGVLDMAEIAEGAVTFNFDQVMKIQARLNEALTEKATTVRPRPDSNTRC